MGRPTKFSQERTERILESLRDGNTREAASAAAGVRYQTFLNWLQKGEEAKSGEYFDFFEAVRGAEVEAEERNVSVVQRAASDREVVILTQTRKTVFKTRKTKLEDGTVIEEPVALEEVSCSEVRRTEFDWRAAAWWLERRKPKQWRERKSIDLSSLTDEQIIALLEDEGEGGGEEEGSSP